MNLYHFEVEVTGMRKVEWFEVENRIAIGDMMFAFRIGTVMAQGSRRNGQGFRKVTVADGSV